MSFLGNLAGNKAMKAHANREYDKALALYEEAYNKGMDQLRMLRSYTILLIRMQHFDKALEVIKKMEKMPGLKPKDQSDLRINYSIILWKKGHLDRALEILNDEFRHTKVGTLYSILGYLKIEKGDAEDALAFNLEALEYDDSDAVFLDNLAQTYYRLLGDKENAKVYFERAIKAKPEAIDTNYFLALYDIDAGNYAGAREKLDTARAGFFSPLNYATPELIEQKLAEIKDKA